MTEPWMCCRCPDSSNSCSSYPPEGPECVIVDFAGIDANPDAEISFIPDGAACTLYWGAPASLAGINTPTLCDFKESVPGGVRYSGQRDAELFIVIPSDGASGCDGSPGAYIQVVRATINVFATLACNIGDDTLRVVAVYASIGAYTSHHTSEPLTDRLLFDWAAADIPSGAGIGSPVPNQLPLSPGSLPSLPALGGFASVTIPTSCVPPTPRHAIAEACDTPGQTIVVDLATNTEDKAGLLYQGDLYFLTPDTTPATPVAVTWVDDYCPEPIVSDWYIATRCPPPGRLNGTWPTQVRYFSPSGPNLDDAIFLNLDGSPRPGCVTSLRYEPTDIPTTDPLPIGIRYDGVTPCNSTDIRVCTGDQPDDPQDVCYLCINVGPSSPQWLQDYCAEFCSPALTAPEDGRVAGGVMGTKATGVKRADARTIRTRQSKAASPARRARIWSKGRMIAEYGLAKASGRNASAETIALRQLSCFGDELAGVPRCPSLVQTRAGAWCGACGCGARREARLDADPGTGHSKLEFTRLTCPRGRPGFSNHEPGETPEAGIREG